MWLNNICTEDSFTPSILVMRKILLLSAFTAVLNSLSAQNVGIGTVSPQARLHVTDSNVVFTGPATVPSTTSYKPAVQGAGTRMMWYPQKGAFRVGSVTGQQWDKDSIGNNSFAAGFNVEAKGLNAVALGNTSAATGVDAIVIGAGSLASNTASVAIGEDNIASGYGSFAFGGSTVASGDISTAMGSQTKAAGISSTAMGNQTIASGNYSLASGDSSVASGASSIALGSHNSASGTGSFSAGVMNSANGNYSTAMGFKSAALMQNAFSIGESDTALGVNSIAMGGSWNKSAGDYSISIGTVNKALGQESIAVGYNAIAASYNSISIGLSNTASNYAAIAIGVGNAASGAQSVALGISSNATGTGSVSLGTGNLSSGNSSFASGHSTAASGDYSTALGIFNTASGSSSFSAGNSTSATGANSASFGYSTNAKSNNSFVIGQYNDNTAANSLFEIGSGTSPASRKNAMTVLNTGNVGIGITNPSYLLHVNNGTVRFEGPATSGTGTASLSVGGFGNVQVDAPGYPGGRLLITENGNVGIGKLNPTQKLVVRTGDSGGLFTYFTTVGLESSNHNYLSFLTGDTFEQGIQFGNPFHSLDGGLIYKPYYSALDPRALYFWAANDVRMKIYNTGNVWIQGSLSQNSDQRLKKNITPLSNPLPALLQLNGYAYNWKNDSLDQHQQIGVLAQEVQIVYPQLVTGNGDNELNVNYIGLIPVLIEGIKEQQRQIERQQSELDALQKTVAGLIQAPGQLKKN